MADKTIAILGARGMLGTDLTRICTRNGYNVRALDLPEFDITSENQISRALKGIPLVVNCAAYTDVNTAESNQKLAHEVNANAVGLLARIAKQNNTFIFHISTDFVFDGKSPQPYAETDTPNPINAYGRTKLAGEKLLAQSGCPHCIIRVQWTYGRAGKNFVNKLIARTREKAELKVVTDQIGSPTATTEAAIAIASLLPKLPHGLFHFAAEGYTSRFDMAKFILDTLGITAQLRPCKTADFPSPAQRPLNSRFNCEKIKPLLEQPVKHWKTPLKQFLKQEKT